VIDPLDPVVSGAVNFRDVGGLPAGPARTRSGMLFRSGNLAQLDEAGVAALGGLGIRRIIDLRADEEVAHAPSKVGGLALQTQRVPLFLGSVASFFADDIPLDEMYRRLVEDSADRVVEVVRGIVSDQPVLVHCTVGKDRTGVTVAVDTRRGECRQRGGGRRLCAHRAASAAVAQQAGREGAQEDASGSRPPRRPRDPVPGAGHARPAGRSHRTLRLAGRLPADAGDGG